MIDGKELEVGPELTECLGWRGVVSVKGDGRRLDQFLVEWDVSDSSGAGDLLQRLLGLDGVVEKIAQERKA